MYNANPAFATPQSSGVREAFEKIPFIASFGSFIDETSILADLVLPDHSPLESWLDDAPPSGSTRMVASLAAPAMSPLHNTRAMPDVLLDVAQQLGGDLAKALPWKTYDEALQAAFKTLYKEQGTKSGAKDADDFWQKVQDQGGWWSAEEKPLPVSAGKLAGGPAKSAAPQFDGDPGQFPFHLLPYASQMWYDGSLANLPWMQEAPDPISSVMWGSWVEINTQTAAKLGIVQGDLLEVASQHGTLAGSGIRDTRASRQIASPCPSARATRISRAMQKIAARIRFRFSRRSPTRKQARSLGPRPASRFRASAKAIWFSSVAASRKRRQN